MLQTRSGVERCQKSDEKLRENPIYKNYDTNSLEEIDEEDENIAQKKVNEMCKKLLANLIIEDFKINKLK